MGQFIDVGKVLIQNSINLIGWPLISISAGPTIDLMLNDFLYAFSIIDFYNQQDSESALIDNEPGMYEEFSFDYRLTKDPILTDTHLEIFMFGELTKVGEECIFE